MMQVPQDRPSQQYIGPQFPGQSYSYYPPPPTFKPFRPAKTLAVAAAVLAIAVTMLELVEMAVAWYSGGQLQNAATDGVAASEIVTAYDIVGLPILLLLIVTWVVTALWLAQARKNAEALNPQTTHARSEIWAWLGWWVPVISFWFPFQFVRDVRRAGRDRQFRVRGSGTGLLPADCSPDNRRPGRSRAGTPDDRLTYGLAGPAAIPTA